MSFRLYCIITTANSKQQTSILGPSQFLCFLSFFLSVAELCHSSPPTTLNFSPAADSPPDDHTLSLRFRFSLASIDYVKKFMLLPSSCFLIPPIYSLALFSFSFSFLFFWRGRRGWENFVFNQFLLGFSNSTTCAAFVFA